MGRDKNSRKRKHSSSSSNRKDRQRFQQGPVDSHKVLRYASLGKARKLRSLLANVQDTADLLRTVMDRGGATALHQAARHGQLEAVQMLLRRSADPSATDAAGNTPGHLAAMHGHLLVLTELVKAAGIDLDKPNAAGFTIRQIVQQQKQAGVHAAPGSNSDASGPTSSIESAEADLAAGPAAASAGATAGAGVGLHREEEDDWMDKLAYEMSYDDGGGFHGAWGGAMAAAAAAAQACGGPGRSPAHRSSRHTSNRGAPSVPRDAYADDDEDDTWADRLWHDMQDHKRQAAMAAAAAAAGRTGSSLPFSAGSSRAEAARERERKAAAAAAESARILKEEQAKDADWRAAMMRQVQEAALPLRRSTYEQRWQQFEAWPAGKPISFKDVPWPCASPGAQAAAHKQEHQQQVLQLDPKQLQTLVLAGARSATDIKLALRKELMRWHPDKFTARYGARLAAADKEAIHAGVHAVAQQLTALKQQ